MIPAEVMMRDEETATKMEMASTDTQAWFGPGRFIVGYPISERQVFQRRLGDSERRGNACEILESTRRSTRAPTRVCQL